MKPIFEMTADQIGKRVRITDQHLSIEGTLSSIRFWGDVNVIRNYLGATRQTVTSLFGEVEIAGAGGPAQLTRQARSEVIEP